MAGKRVSFATMAGAPVVSVPGRDDPHTAPLADIAFNPDNPRDPEEFDSAEFTELKASFLEVGQLQPVLVASRKVFLAHFPHHADEIGTTKWVVLGGNRRLEAARQLGWTSMDIKVRDDLGSGEGSLNEAVMIENIHRKNLPPLREAEFLQRMLERQGTQDKVATRIGKTQAYVSQRLSLLRLAPELKTALETGELKVKQARALASIEDPEQQVAAWKLAPAPTEPSEALVHNPVMGGAGSVPQGAAHNPVMGTQGTSTPEAAPHNRVMKQPGGHRAGSPPVPSPRTTQGGAAVVDPVTLVRQLGETPQAIADTLRAGMTPDDFEAFVELLTEQL